VDVYRLQNEKKSLDRKPAPIEVIM